MQKIYVDATQPLNWGRQPLVGIPRVEAAIIRQALRRNEDEVQFFMIDMEGRGQLLTTEEHKYLTALVEVKSSTREATLNRSYIGTIWAAFCAIRMAPITPGKEFDRYAASLAASRTRQNSLACRVAKITIRALKRLHRGLSKPRPSTLDPLTRIDARCLLSNLGLHRVAKKRLGPINANVTSLLHDTIALDLPDFFTKGQCRGIERDLAWQFKNCRQIICMSEYTAIRANYHIARSQPTCLPQVTVSNPGSFLKGSLLKQNIRPIDALLHSRFAIYCSTIEARKNHLTLLKIWSFLLPIIGDRLPMLLLVGRWGWKYEAVKSFLRADAALRSKVVIMSHLGDDQLAWAYQNAIFGLFPSVMEGWGLGAAECLDFGLPVLISDAPALFEATQGLMPVIGATDIAGWCSAVCHAATDDIWLQSLRATIVRRFRQIPESDFADEVLAQVSDRPMNSFQPVAVRTA